MSNEKHESESGDHDGKFASRIFSLLTLTVSELRLLNVKTKESGDIIKQLLRFVTLFDEVAKLKVNIDHNLNALKRKQEHFIDIHNNLHNFEEEISAIMEELDLKDIDIKYLKESQRSCSRIPKRVTNSKKTFSTTGKPSIYNLEMKMKALDNVRKICTELGYDGKIDENDFLRKIFEEQKLKIKNILPVIELHTNFYTNLSTHVEDFQNFIDNLVAEIKKTTDCRMDELSTKNVTKENLKLQTDESEIIASMIALERQKTKSLRRTLKNSQTKLNLIPLKTSNKETETEFLERPNTQSSRRNWIKVQPEQIVKPIKCANFRPVLTPILEEVNEPENSLKKKKLECSDGDKYCNNNFEKTYAKQTELGEVKHKNLVRSGRKRDLQKNKGAESEAVEIKRKFQNTSVPMNYQKIFKARTTLSA